MFGGRMGMQSRLGVRKTVVAGPGFWWKVRNFPAVWWGFWRLLVARLLGLPVLYGELRVRLRRADGTWVNYGLVSTQLVTTTGKGFVVDAFQNLVELENAKYHGVGTGTTAAAAGDTALQTESTTALNPDSTRATGSTTESAQTVYRSVGTNTFDAAAAITEWGLLTQAATGGGVLVDRAVFAAINVASGDQLTTTYDLTLS